MVTARNVTILLVTLVAIGFVVGVINTHIEPGPNRIASDSFSGLAPGHRALLETLQTLGISARRHTTHAENLYEGNRRVILFEPNPARLEREHGYLTRMGDWVRAGGELVVLGRAFEPDWDETGAGADDDDAAEDEDKDNDEDEDHDLPKLTLYDALGMAPLAINTPEFEDQLDAGYGPFALTAPTRAEDFVAAPLEAEGAFAPLGDDLGTVGLLLERLSYIADVSGNTPTGTLRVRIHDGDAQPHTRTIGVRLDVGEGHAVFVTVPEIATNLGIGQAGNAVLAVALASGDGSREVVFDEYYHGIVPEGSWLTLAGRFPYTLIFLSILAAVAAQIWRSATRLGPPDPEAPPSRRGIGEYIDAMASLYARARKHEFALRTCREGIVDDVRESLRLPAATPEDTALRRYALAHPERADALERVLAEIDAMFASRSPINKTTLSTYQEAFEQCRPPTSPPRLRPAN